jgi:glycosyltransferase involved in cell wall biosynthesis
MSKRLRVGIDARILAEAAPMGVSRFTAALLRAAAELAPQHDYLLYFREEALREPPFTTSPFVPRVLSGPSVMTSPLVWQQVYLPWQAWRDRVDVLFSPYYCGPLLAWTPQVVCICDISFSLFPQEFPSWIHFKPKLLARPSSRRARKVMTISEFSRQELLRVYGLWPEKVVVIHAGTEEQYWRRESIRAAQARPRSDAPFFLFVGSLLPRRQVEAVLQALSQLPAQYQLVVVGETEAEGVAKLTAAAQRWNVAERLACLGHVSDEALEQLYAHAVALVSPSTYEGFGLPVLEALQRGVPVIAWDIPVVREVVGDAAMLLPIGDLKGLVAAMERVASDPDVRQSFRRAGKERAQQFSWRHSATAFLGLLHEVVREKRKG